MLKCCSGLFCHSPVSTLYILPIQAPCFPLSCYTGEKMQNSLSSSNFSQRFTFLETFPLIQEQLFFLQCRSLLPTHSQITEWENSESDYRITETLTLLDISIQEKKPKPKHQTVALTLEIQSCFNLTLHFPLSKSFYHMRFQKTLRRPSVFKASYANPLFKDKLLRFLSHNYLKSSFASRNWSCANCIKPACCKIRLYITYKREGGKTITFLRSYSHDASQSCNKYIVKTLNTWLPTGTIK